MSGSIGPWLAQKYGILQQEADARTTAAQSQSAYQKGLVSAIPAEIERARAQAGLYGAQTQRTNTLLPIEAETAYQGMLNDGPAGGPAISRIDEMFPGQQTTTPRPLESAYERRKKYLFGTGLVKGTARVPGKGDGTKDTVPAMLAPGEAVLNKSAADTAGRGLIAVLNELGARKMGMV